MVPNLLKEKPYVMSSIRKNLLIGTFLTLLTAQSPRAATPFALGLQIGSSDGGNFSGLTGRVGEVNTLEGILALEDDGWILNGNFLTHSRSLFRQNPIDFMKLYAGFGAGVWTPGKGGVWVQVPLGVDIRFAIPVEASLYVAPGMNIMPETEANWHFGLGIRYWFK